MTPVRTEATLVEAGLRAEIRLLGQLLGDTLREHEGVPLYELEESIRNRTKALRQEYDARDEAALVADLDRIPLEDAARLVRAFATYFQLVNLAELERQARSVDGDTTGELDRLLARCRERDIAGEQVARLLERIEVRPVLTAHPTEAVRRSILDHQDRIGEELARLRAPLAAKDQERVRSRANRSPASSRGSRSAPFLRRILPRRFVAASSITRTASVRSWRACARRSRQKISSG